MIPVQWGKPSRDSIAAADLGLLRLGGCIVRGEPHTTWWCTSCEVSILGEDTTEALHAARSAVAEAE